MYLSLHSKASQVCQLMDSRSGPRTFRQTDSRLCLSLDSMDFHSRAMVDNKLYRSQFLILASRLWLNLASSICNSLVLKIRICSKKYCNLARRMGLCLGIGE